MVASGGNPTHTKKYGIADPLVGDIAKTLSLQALGGLALGEGLRIPTVREIMAVSFSMGIYYYMINPMIGETPIETHLGW